VVDASGDIIKGKLSIETERFVSDFKDEIVEDIGE
jgi:hypothetical protein